LMIQAAESQDMHLATALLIFANKIAEENIQPGSDEMKVLRYMAKQINFAVLYGAEAYKIAEMSEGSLTEEDAEELINRYFTTFHVLKAFIDGGITKAKVDGFVKSIFNRIRPLPELYASSYKMREKAEREVFSTLCQGTAIDIVKQAMLRLRSLFPRMVRLVLQVHDEMLWEVPDDLLQICIELSKDLKQSFPLYPFHTSVGKVYGEMVELKETPNAPQ